MIQSTTDATLQAEARYIASSSAPTVMSTTYVTPRTDLDAAVRGKALMHMAHSSLDQLLQLQCSAATTAQQNYHQWLLHQTIAARDRVQRLEQQLGAQIQQEHHGHRVYQSSQ
jgi:hypothetical protein